LDILSSIGSSLAGFLKTQKIEKNKEDSAVLSSSVVTLLTSKFRQLRPLWLDNLSDESSSLLQALANEEEAAKDETSKVPEPVKKKKGRPSKAGKGAEKVEAEVRVETAANVKFDIRTAFSILLEVTKISKIFAKSG